MTAYKQTILEMASVLEKHNVLENIAKDDRNKKQFAAFNEMVKIYDRYEEENGYQYGGSTNAFYQAILHYLGVIDLNDQNCPDITVASGLMTSLVEFMIAGSLKSWISDIKNSHSEFTPIKL